MKSILLALDRREEAQQLVDYIKPLAKKFDSKIWIVHIADPEPDYIGYEVGPQYIRDFRAKDLKEEHTYLISLSESLSEDGIESQSILLEGYTADMLVKESEKLKVDIIVLGSHKHGLLHRMFAGDTTNSVIMRSTIPVLAVPIVTID